jgi:hypothetical protein
MQLELLAGGEARAVKSIWMDRDRLFGQDRMMNKQTVGSNEYATLAELGLQQAERFALQLSIEVCGFDRCGRFFTERSETCDISDGGCKFYLRTEVDREAVVALRAIERYNQRGNGAAPVLFQVANMERGPNGWTLGALKLRAEDSWPMRSLHARGGAASFD